MMTFRFDPSESTVLVEVMNKIDGQQLDEVVLPKIGTVEWWPVWLDGLARRKLVAESGYDIYVKEDVISYRNGHKEARRTFFAIDPTRGVGYHWY